MSICGRGLVQLMQGNSVPESTLGDLKAGRIAVQCDGILLENNVKTCNIEKVIMFQMDYGEEFEKESMFR